MIVYIISYVRVRTSGTVYELISGKQIQLLGPNLSPIERVINIEIL